VIVFTSLGASKKRVRSALLLDVMRLAHALGVRVVEPGARMIVLRDRAAGEDRANAPAAVFAPAYGAPPALSADELDALVDGLAPAPSAAPGPDAGVTPRAVWPDERARFELAVSSVRVLLDALDPSARPPPAAPTPLVARRRARQRRCHFAAILGDGCGDARGVYVKMLAAGAEARTDAAPGGGEAPSWEGEVFRLGVSFAFLMREGAASFEVLHAGRDGLLGFGTCPLLDLLGKGPTPLTVELRRANQMAHRWEHLDCVGALKCVVEVREQRDEDANGDASGALEQAEGRRDAESPPPFSLSRAFETALEQAKAQRHAAFLDEETDSASAAMVRAREWRRTTLAALHRHDGAEGAQEGGGGARGGGEGAREAGARVADPGSVELGTTRV